MKLHNTLTGKVEPFEPAQKNRVGMYICGITPYDSVHLGHARCYVVFDVLVRHLEASGNKVTYIRNITDIDDKLIAKSRKSGETMEAVAKRYSDEFDEAMKKLGLRPPDKEPRVTQHLPEIIALVEKIVRNGFAYAANGSVYFLVRKFDEHKRKISGNSPGKGYGSLSNRSIDDMISGARVEPEPGKNDPLDFALWKAAKPDEPAWDSPWGRGRPGWHIECSAMSMKYLGETLDLHGGGQDLVFPHHENELAQSETATGKPFCRFWVHNGYVLSGKEKMSKSLGNIWKLDDVLAKYSPPAVRLFLLSAHYRRPLESSDEKLQQSQRQWAGISHALAEIKNSVCRISERGNDGHAQPPRTNVAPAGVSGVAGSAAHPVEKWKNKFTAALDDDLNTPEALAAFHGYIQELRTWLPASSPEQAAQAVAALETMAATLGLPMPSAVIAEIPAEVTELVGCREKARLGRDWPEADKIRKAIESKGFLVEDTKEGPKVRKK